MKLKKKEYENEVGLELKASRKVIIHGKLNKLSDWHIF